MRINNLHKKDDTMATMLKNGFKWEVGDTKKIFFWEDICFKDKFPRLYMISLMKRNRVANCGAWNVDH